MVARVRRDVAAELRDVFSTDCVSPPIGRLQGKFELDSLAAVLKSSCAYWNATRDATLLADETWLSAMERIMDTIEVQQNSTEEDGNHPAYTFARRGAPAYPNKPAYRCGLSKCECSWPLGLPRRPPILVSNVNQSERSFAARCFPPQPYPALAPPPSPPARAIRVGGFRPSDDNTALPFLVSANAMAAVELGRLAEMAATGTGGRLANITQRATALSAQLRAAVEAQAPQNVAGFGSIYAYEVDGAGNFSVADDSNVPSLLSLPYLGYCSRTDRE